MKGYKDTTRTCYSKGGPAGGLKGAAQIGAVMKGFKQGAPGPASKVPPKKGK